MLAQDDLARAVLDNAPVNDIGLERLLTGVRTILLDAATQAKSEVSREMITFAASLARQCFINEYVFDVSETERQALAWLRTLGALRARRPRAGVRDPPHCARDASRRCTRSTAIRAFSRATGSSRSTR